MEKIRHDSSYEWLSGESWNEWSASFFSMGWKIWGVVLITELFLFLFFKPTADCAMDGCSLCGRAGCSCCFFLCTAC